MKRKYFIIFAALLLVLTLCMGLAACGNDSGNKPDSPIDTPDDEQPSLTQEEIKAYIPTTFEMKSGMSIDVHQFGESIQYKKTVKTADGEYKEVEMHDVYFENAYYKDADGNDIYTTIGKDKYYRTESYGSFFVENYRRSFINYNGKSYRQFVSASDTSYILNEKYPKYSTETYVIPSDVEKMYVESEQNNLIAFLDTLKNATDYNAETSREILGDDYDITYKYNKKTEGQNVIETVNATSRFVMNFTNVESSRIEDYWYPVAETCVMRIDVNVIYENEVLQRVELRLSYDKDYNPASRAYVNGSVGQTAEPLIYEGVDIDFSYGNVLSIPVEDINGVATVENTTLVIADEALPADFDKTVRAGEEVVLPDLFAEDKTFDGWYFDSDCTYKVKDNRFVPDGQTVSLYTKWKYKEPELELGGGKLSSISLQNFDQVKTYNDLIVLFPEKDGYAFVGWYTDEELTTIIDYTSTDDYKGEKLFAKYEKLITVTPIVTEGVSYKIIPQKGKAGTKLFLPTETDLGFTFEKWYYEDGETVGSTFPSEDCNVYLSVTEGIIATVHVPINVYEYNDENVYSFTMKKGGVKVSDIEKKFIDLYEKVNDVDLRDRIDGEALERDGVKYYYKQLIDAKQTAKTNLYKLKDFSSEKFYDEVKLYAAYTPHEKVRLTINLDGVVSNADTIDIDIEQWEYELKGENPKTKFDGKYVFSEERWQEIIKANGKEMLFAKFGNEIVFSPAMRSSTSSVDITTDSTQVEFEKEIVDILRKNFGYALSLDIENGYKEYPSVANFSLTIYNNETRQEVRLHRDGEEKSIYVVNEIPREGFDSIKGVSLQSFSIIGLPSTLKRYFNRNGYNSGYSSYNLSDYVANRSEYWKSPDFAEDFNLGSEYAVNNGKLFGGYYFDKDFTEEAFDANGKFDEVNWSDKYYEADNGVVHLYLKYVNDVRIKFTSDNHFTLQGEIHGCSQENVLSFGVRKDKVKDSSEFGNLITRLKDGDTVSFYDYIEYDAESGTFAQTETPTRRENVTINRNGWTEDGAISDDVEVYELNKDENGDYYIDFTTLLKCNDYTYGSLFMMLSNVVCAYTLNAIKGVDNDGNVIFDSISASMWSYEYLQKGFDENPDKLTEHFAKSFDETTGEFTTDVIVLKYPVKYDENGERL
ncbi:MAG TPA: hypothetical protein DEF02_03355 [Clostridiales bacterium]|nr:hypothetical protein [Clostridiales bacterium]